MEQAKLNKIIGQARLDRSTSLNSQDSLVAPLPESIGNIVNLNHLYLKRYLLTSLPESIGNFINLTHLYLGYDLSANLGLTNTYMQAKLLTGRPGSIDNLVSLTNLSLGVNQLASLPESIGDLINLTHLDLKENQLTSLPESIGNLVNLIYLDLGRNQLTSLPKSIINISNLCTITWNGNPLVDLSILKIMRNSDTVRFFDVFLPRKYWTKLSEWKSEWLLDENNAEVRRALIAQIGYEKICHELNAVAVNTWREYTLLKIDGVERVYNKSDKPIDLEAMVLLKMTCPSTGHIHILRVPPAMTSAEAAITWVNHGIHPDKFAVQT